MRGSRLHGVCSALSKGFIPASVALLNDKSVYLEVGKNNIWSAERMAAASSCAPFRLVAADYKPGPWHFAQLLELNVRVEADEVKPLPITLFRFEAAEIDAFASFAGATTSGATLRSSVTASPVSSVTLSRRLCIVCILAGRAAAHESTDVARVLDLTLHTMVPPTARSTVRSSRSRSRLWSRAVAPLGMLAFSSQQRQAWSSRTPTACLSPLSTPFLVYLVSGVTPCSQLAGFAVAAARLGLVDVVDAAAGVSRARDSAVKRLFRFQTFLSVAPSDFLRRRCKRPSTRWARRAPRSVRGTARPGRWSRYSATTTALCR